MALRVIKHIVRSQLLEQMFRSTREVASNLMSLGVFRNSEFTDELVILQQTIGREDTKRIVDQSINEIFMRDDSHWMCEVSRLVDELSEAIESAIIETSEKVRATPASFYNYISTLVKTSKRTVECAEISVKINYSTTASVAALVQDLRKQREEFSYKNLVADYELVKLMADTLQADLKEQTGELIDNWSRATADIMGDIAADTIVRCVKSLTTRKM